MILRDYDESLKPSKIHFDCMDIWARIIDLPLGSINKIGGERAMGLIGEVKRMDVDKDVKTSGPYLRARVSIEVSKPVHRGVMLKAKEEAVLEWFDIQYEKIPYFCSSCGVMGHSHLECDKPLIRNNDGKLSYEVKQLRVQDPKRKNCKAFQRLQQTLLGVQRHLCRSNRLGQRICRRQIALRSIVEIQLERMMRRFPPR